MDFTFTEDQLLFQQSVRDFLTNEVTPDTIRAGWETDSGRSDALWAQLAELGLTGLTVPEAHGGLGMSELDFVLLAQEAGYVALPEPLVHVALVAVPTLLACGDEALQREWLPRIATGEARVVVGEARGHPLILFVAVEVEAHPGLAQVAAAGRGVGQIQRPGHGRHEQGRQQRDHEQDHEQFDQGKSSNNC